MFQNRRAAAALLCLALLTATGDAQSVWAPSRGLHSMQAEPS